MAITNKLSAIADSMRAADGSERTYNLNQMAERPGVWQETIAEAITAKGVDTLPDSSFDEMAVNIGLIGGSGDAAYLVKAIETSADVSSGKFTLATQQELVDAGILESTADMISSLWENVMIIFRSSAHGVNYVLEAAFHKPVVAFSTRYYRTAFVGTSSSQQFYGSDSSLNTSTSGMLEENSEGLQLSCATSRKVGRTSSPHMLFILCSGKI